jgi:hypothetical protein
MTLDERRNEAPKLHGNFVNALAIGAVVGGGVSALSQQNWIGALFFVLGGAALDLIAAEIIERLRITA